MSDEDDTIVEGSATEIPAAETDHRASGEQEPGASNGVGEGRPNGLVAIRPPAGREVLMPLEAERVVEGMRRYQRLLRDLLEPSDWQTHDKRGNPLERPFLKKCGWRKIARAFNLSFERISGAVERDEAGRPLRAEAWIRAVAPNGQYGDGDGYCSVDEGRFNSARGRAKLENDLRTTATTRAKNRAVADLVGMGEVSAEEIEPAGEDDGGSGRAGRPASDELGQLAAKALRKLLGDRAGEAGRRIVADYGHLTAAAGRALCHAAAARGGESEDRTGQTGERRSTEESPPNPVPEDRSATGEGGSASRADLAYWQRRGGYSDVVVASLSELACDESNVERLADERLDELCTLVEFAARGKVSTRTLTAWLRKLVEEPDRGAAVQALLERLREKANEVELVGRRQAA